MRNAIAFSKFSTRLLKQKSSIHIQSMTSFATIPKETLNPLVDNMFEVLANIEVLVHPTVF